MHQYPRRRDRQTSFASVPSLSAKQVFFSDEVLLSRIPQVFWQKHTTEPFILQNSSQWLLLNKDITYLGRTFLKKHQFLKH